MRYIRDENNMQGPTGGKVFLTDLNVEPGLLVDCVAYLYHHDQSEHEVRPVITAMVDADTAPSKPIQTLNASI